MKKLLSISVLLASTLILLNCTKISEENLDENVGQPHSEFVVPIDSALLYLSDFLDGVSGTKTRSSLMDKIKNIQTVKFNSNTTKASNYSGQQGNDELMYLVNFCDDQGYAILSADNRIETPVLALTDKGSISANDFNKIYDVPSRELEQDGEPTPNSYPGKSFIINVEGENFDLYCPEDDDYYFGGNSDTEIQQQYLLNMVDSYARNSVTNSTGSQYHRGGPETIVEEKVLLTTKWYQGSPFNDFSPIKGGKRSPAGCVAIALGQIMTYHKYPQNLTCNGVYCDWDKMLEGEYYPSTPSARTMLASFIATIGNNCRLWYGKENTFGTAQNAKNCLKWFGYENVHKDLGYDAATIISMIDDDNPVFIAALSSITGGGHAWVIDGYKYQREAPVTKAGNYYGRRTSGPSYQVRPNTLLVHCNFGWSGRSNGYYASGVFNIKEGPLGLAHGDLSSSSQINSNYNWWFRILTYTNPNK